MTWYFDPDGKTMDVYDHSGTLVAESVEFSGVWGTDDDGNVVNPPPEVYEVMRGVMEGNQPSAYNQGLLADAATDNIKRGTPP